ncbi:hypothetical protein [Janthinobacterium sp.]|uniref:hypothetical protein n=1 Tax=Janthinobacterium sp. TaxID=1871054 RepID=UPI00293D64CF|nr:hypothetical protein [Janthinobacterium sp.]
MKDLNSPPEQNIFKEAGRAFARCARFTARTLGQMSWPALLLSCVVLAMLITIVPLALGLFVLFLIVKYLLASPLFKGLGGASRQR